MADLPPSCGEGEVSARRTVAVIAVGGALGALARYGVGLLFLHDAGAFPWGTFLINVTGCLLIGSLIVVVTEWTRAHPLVRPFLVTGILGGFTTFSTYTVDAEQLLAAGRIGTAAAYVVGTAVAAIAATGAGIGLARAVRAAARR